MTRARRIERVIGERLQRDGWIVSDDYTWANKPIGIWGDNSVDLDIAALASELDAEFDRITRETASA